MKKFPEVYESIIRLARLKRYPKGQIIQYQGDVLGDVFLIKSGAVKLYDIDDQGNEKILHITKSPAIIPYSFFTGNVPPKWFYSALTDCELYVLPYDVLEKIILENNKLAWTLTNGFSRETHELMVRLSSLGKTRAPEKLVATLWFLAVWHSEERRGGWRRVNFPVNHQLLADITGITRERAAMVMKELQDKKVIRNPRLTVLEINQHQLKHETES